MTTGKINQVTVVLSKQSSSYDAPGASAADPTILSPNKLGLPLTALLQSDN